MTLHLQPLGTLARRRVVQVAIAAGAMPDGGYDWSVFALCDDSSVWWLELDQEGDNWTRLPAVPGTQDEVPE